MAKDKKKNTTREIHNKRAEFEYFFVSQFEAGIMLTGTEICLLYTSPSPRDQRGSRMPSSA